MTKEIYMNLPLEIQMFIWFKVDELKERVKLDYLQVFELEHIGKGVVRITYRQQVPLYEEATQRVNEEIDHKLKVFVIDRISTVLYVQL